MKQHKPLQALPGILSASSKYFSLLMEAMSQEAQRMGFSEEIARQLVLNAAIGAAPCHENIINDDKEQNAVTNQCFDAGKMIKQVTSKGGTTAEALGVFEQHQLAKILAVGIQQTAETTAIHSAQSTQNPR